MVDEVWLHIGSAKSGTSSLQKYFDTRRAALSDQGLAYITAPKRATINELVFAYNKPKDDPTELARALNAQIEARPERIGMLSSEMLFGFKPEVVYQLLPALRDRPLHVLAYLRRQDHYIEAVYLQKSKNFRFLGSIDAYIEKFKGSGSDYAEVLAGWRQDGHARLVPRVMERAKLLGGSVVTDALAQIGLPTEGVEEDPDNNVSPGYHRVQLLQAAAMAELANPRKLQRRLAADYPQSPEDRTPVLNKARRRAWLDNFKSSNEELRQAYFPDLPSLFDESDLDGPEEEGGVPPFTQAQLREVAQLFKTLKKLKAVE